MKKFLMIGLITTGLFASCEYEYNSFVKNKNTTYDFIKYNGGDINICSSNDFTITKAIRAKQECKDEKLQKEIINYLEVDGKKIKDTCLNFGYK